MKTIEFLGSSRDDLMNFPADARRVAGYELRRVQAGEEPSDWKPMASVGAGVKEIRIRVLGEWRVLYVTKFAERIFVLHCFRKKTQKTRQSEIDLAKERTKQIKR